MTNSNQYIQSNMDEHLDDLTNKTIPDLIEHGLYKLPITGRINIDAQRSVRKYMNSFDTKTKRDLKQFAELNDSLTKPYKCMEFIRTRIVTHNTHPSAISFSNGGMYDKDDYWKLDCMFNKKTYTHMIKYKNLYYHIPSSDPNISYFVEFDVDNLGTWNRYIPVNLIDDTKHGDDIRIKMKFPISTIRVFNNKEEKLDDVSYVYGNHYGVFLMDLMVEYLTQVKYVTQ